MHAISSYRGNRHRPPARPPARLPARYKHTHRQDRLQYTAPLASVQCNYPASLAVFYGLAGDGHELTVPQRIVFGLYLSDCTEL